MTARELTDLILSLAPLSGEVAGDQNGFLYGDPETVVQGIAVCWSPTADVLRQAAAEGLNFILSHEIMFFPSTATAQPDPGAQLPGDRADTTNPGWYELLTEAERPHNQVRRELMDRHGLVHCRCHSNWDCIPTHGIADACATALGFPEPVYRSHFLRLYELPPRTLSELAQHCKQRLGIPHVRLAGDPAREVSRVGIAYGGFGQSWQCLDEYIIHGAEAVIIGEGIDYTFRAAVDAGLGLIETSHVGSENPGMRAFAQLLTERLPAWPVRFIDSGHPWVLA